jgi:hypothetical protein
MAEKKELSDSEYLKKIYKKLDSVEIMLGVLILGKVVFTIINALNIPV